MTGSTAALRAAPPLHVESVTAERHAGLLERRAEQLPHRRNVTGHLRRIGHLI